MKLTNQQIKQFDEEGYIIISELFSPKEVEKLKGEISGIFAQRRDENVRENDGDTVRTAFATHTYNDVYGRFVCHPKILEPAEQLLEGQVYVHQFKLNAKAAFNGDVWQWHQDYGTWKNDDGMPEGLALNVAIFLDDVSNFNGPLNFIPRSHRDGYLNAAHDTITTSYPLWTLSNKKISQLVSDGGIIAPTGKAGSTIFFDSSLVHGSPSNMSPWSRNIVYISLNRTSNCITKFSRPEYIAHRDFDAITTLEDNCLLNSQNRE